jgi:serine/threonine-protein kinase
MLLALGAIALVALGILLAWLLLHRDSSSPQQTGTTVVITTTAPPTSTTAATPPPSAARKAVPDLKGVKLADAQSRLSSLGLKTTTTPVTSTAQPAGTVIDQSPKAGAKVAKGATVTLSVVKAPANATTTAPATTNAQATTTTATTTGATTTAPTTTVAQPQSATVPDVQGQTEAAAAQALGQAGILPSITFVPGTDPLGTVLEQAKSSGTTVPYHSHVQINISRGPNNNPLEQVPSVVGKTLQDAVSALQGAHLRLIYLKFPVTSRVQAGKIVQQSPLGGGQAPQNAQVLVFLGAYRAG